MDESNAEAHSCPRSPEVIEKCNFGLLFEQKILHMFVSSVFVESDAGHTLPAGRATESGIRTALRCPAPVKNDQTNV